MKKILLFALMTFFVQTSFCQNLSDTVNIEYSKNSPKRLTLGIGAPFGFMWLFSPNINKTIQTQNIKTNNMILSVPIMVNYQKDRYKIGIEAYYGFLSSTDNGNKNIASSSMQADIIDASFGYAIFAERNYFIYFNLGVGYAEYLKTIDIHSPQTTTFSSALQSGIGQSIALKNSGAFLDFSMESVIRTKKVQALGKSIKIGYRYGLQESTWTSKFNNITETPSDRINSVYLQVILTLPYLSNTSKN